MIFGCHNSWRSHTFTMHKDYKAGEKIFDGGSQWSRRHRRYHVKAVDGELVRRTVSGVQDIAMGVLLCNYGHGIVRCHVIDKSEADVHDNIQGGQAKPYEGGYGEGKVWSNHGRSIVAEATCTTSIMLG